ncbi:MAG: preprotein translocase subunit YajC [Bacteroidia bacterium]|nr:preprotein translocase subunit YajC [Bacteroidia bacterium]
MQQELLLILQDGSGPGNNFFIIYLVAIVFIFYFFFMRPQAKKSKEQQKFKDQLQKGDRVVTNGGIHGKIVKIDEHSLLIEIDTNTKIRIEKNAISAELSKQFDKETA